MEQEIIAPISGKVVELKINVGDTVKEDDETLVLESMKMETPIFSPCNGTVKEIRIKVGDTVEEDDTVAVIEES